MNDLQKAGGVSALIAAATYLFAMSLVFTVLAPLTDPALGFGEYVGLLSANRLLVFIWHSAMYLVNGICLVVLALALYGRLADGSPRLAKVATIFGLFWAGLVVTSGLITNYGTEAILRKSAENPAHAETLRLTVETVTLGIDSSDRFLGCLWVGLVSLAALRTKAFPTALNILGLTLGLAGLVGTSVPALLPIAYAFGLGVIVWWIGIGIILLGRSKK